MEQSLYRYLQSVGWLRWLFMTKSGEIVIGQFPNAPLIVGLLAKGVEVVSGGPVQNAAGHIAQAAFAVWAILEIGWGVNPFRRILGTVALAFIGWNVLQSFG
ncbi:hypothetical protein EON79_06060 [bacterium]|nr:MAG: hypothetical protein EON79_06060 [bacterium]